MAKVRSMWEDELADMLINKCRMEKRLCRLKKKIADHLEEDDVEDQLDFKLDGTCGRTSRNV